MSTPNEVPADTTPSVSDWAAWSEEEKLAYARKRWAFFSEENSKPSERPSGALIMFCGEDEKKLLAGKTGPMWAFLTEDLREAHYYAFHLPHLMMGSRINVIQYGFRYNSYVICEKQEKVEIELAPYLVRVREESNKNEH